MTANINHTNIFLATFLQRENVMSTVKSEVESKDPQNLVKRLHPEAFSYDDGEKVFILDQTIVTEKCPTCGQDWTHKIDSINGKVLGSGGDSSQAWKSAAQNLGLV